MLKSLQNFRAIAALAVVAAHLTTIMALPKYGALTVLPWATPIGSRGVEFFFVISGFIIAFVHARDVGRPETLTAYASKRFVRLYPIYWIYTAVFAAALLAGLGDSLRVSTPLDWLTTFSLIRFTSVQTPLPQAWTLFHEVLFYAAFATLLVNRRVGGVVLAVWALACLSAMAFAPPQAAFLALIVSTANLNFGFGLAAYGCHTRLNRPVAIGLAAFGIAVLGLAAFGMFRPIGAPGELAWGLGFGAVVAAFTALERQGWRLRQGALSLIGDASYSIYLTHAIFISAGLKALGLLGGTSVAPPMIIYAGLLIVSVCGGVALYGLVERPLLGRLRTLAVRRGPGAPPSESVRGPA